MRRLPIALGLVLVLIPVAEAADFGIGVRAGTQGLGAEGAIGIKKWVSIRGGIYSATISRDFEEGGIDYDGDLEVGGFGALVDFFPVRGNFRLSAGLFSNNNEIEITANVIDTIDIGDNTYTAAEVGALFGRVDFDSSAPYLGIGWGRLTTGKRVGFLFDLGALLQGSGNATLDATNPTVSEQFSEDLRREEAEIEDDIKDVDFWPIISFGIAIRF